MSGEMSIQAARRTGRLGYRYWPVSWQRCILPGIRLYYQQRRKKREHITIMIKQPSTYIHTDNIQKKVKPLMRGWSHAIAAVASIVLTVILCVLSRHDIPRMISMLIFGLSMTELYTISAVYHIVTWSPAKR